ncbi:50S ribosomal protein L32 [Candidatus Curtissbacteria bacterium]|nr:50S ribosomal protein L32 [Candidatus Curtissbacteria bacterium]
MAPLPKKKHAKSRTRTRKAAIHFKLPSLIVCPNCQSLKLPHKVCPNCGYYSAKITVKVKSHEKKK